MFFMGNLETIQCQQYNRVLTRPDRIVAYSFDIFNRTSVKSDWMIEWPPAFSEFAGSLDPSP